MKKKYVNLIITLIILFNSFIPSFLFAESKSQPEVCSGPSEMMAQYFNFQKEIKSALLGKFNEKRFYKDVGQGRLFTKQVLTLPTPSAIDFLASNIRGSTKSILSNSVTSAVILLLASASVLQSNTEGLAILFKDRPIVREYKTMLDIETDLFNIAYFQSKSINLTIKLDGEIYENINNIIKKYQESGLFDNSGPKSLNGNESMADILIEMISINTSMKNFILFLGKPKTNSLRHYHGCFGNIEQNLCSNSNAILIFSEEAITQLQNDYSHLSMFGACNLYASNIKQSIRKLRNVTEPLNSAKNEINNATKRLKAALLGQKSTSSDKKNRCDLSDYEMAQLRAYRGPDWSCSNGLVDLSVDLPKVNEYFQNKKVQNEQRKQSTNLIQQSAIPESTSETLFDINKDIKNTYDSLIEQYEQSQNNAIASDLSYELKQIKGVLDQVDASINNAEILKGDLKKIANYQCAS